jgi:hypothetical protein
MSPKGTLVGKGLSPFRGASIDDLLYVVSANSERVRVCAEGMMDDIIIKTHKVMNDDLEMTKNIGTMTQQTGGNVEKLHEKVDEILKSQKSLQSLQITLNAISGKNALLDFLVEYLSTCRKYQVKVC